jgi:hypothetical protein
LKIETRSNFKKRAKFRSKRKDLQSAITSLERYLTNNQTRIYYRRFPSYSYSAFEQLNRMGKLLRLQMGSEGKSLTSQRRLI